MPKVAVTDYDAFNDLTIEREILEPLGCEVVGHHKYTDEAALISLVADADYVLTVYAPVTEAVIAAMTRCKAVVRYGIGVDNIDIQAAARHNLPACNNPDYCIDEVADHALAMILSLTRQVPIAAAGAAAGLAPSDAGKYALRVLSDMTVGVVGFGRIGSEVAGRLKPFHCEVKVFDPVVEDAVIAAQGCTPTSLDELYGSSDVIALQCPCNEHTQHMINAASLAKMKPGVMLVNVARGGLVNTPDLLEALAQGRVSAAALDTTEPEPLPQDSPLFTLDNVIVTNHIAYASNRSKITLRTGAINVIADAVKGEKLRNVVNGVAV